MRNRLLYCRQLSNGLCQRPDPSEGRAEEEAATNAAAGIAEGKGRWKVQSPPTLTWFLCLGLLPAEPEECLDAADIDGVAVEAIEATEEVEGTTPADGGRWYGVCCINRAVVGCADSDPGGYLCGTAE